MFAFGGAKVPVKSCLNQLIVAETFKVWGSIGILMDMKDFRRWAVP